MTKMGNKFLNKNRISKRIFMKTKLLNTSIQLLLSVVLLLSCNHSNSITVRKKNKVSQAKKTISEDVNNSSKQQSEENLILDFVKLYPILKKSLLGVVCESYVIKEESTMLQAISKEVDMNLSSWEWDLKNKPVVVKDIDNDGKLDYTIELINEGGGCGGNMGEEERWTLFGSKPDRFVWTHLIPYRSVSGKWEEIIY